MQKREAEFVAVSRTFETVILTYILHPQARGRSFDDAREGSSCGRTGPEGRESVSYFLTSYSKLDNFEPDVLPSVPCPTSLDFDDDPIPSGSIDFAPSTSSTIISPMSTGTAPPPARNALDDMLDLFSQSSMAPPSAPIASAPAPSFSNSAFGQPLNGSTSRPQQQPPQQTGAEDLLGLF